jgi:hypothetical protein
MSGMDTLLSLSYVSYVGKGLTLSVRWCLPALMDDDDDDDDDYIVASRISVQTPSYCLFDTVGTL